MSEPATAPGEQHSSGPGHQPDALHYPLIWGLGIGLAVVILVAHLVTLWIFEGLRIEGRTESTPFSRPGGNPAPLPRAPVLEGVEQQQGQKISFTPEDLRPERQPQLNSYGWVNRDAGIVRIPLQQAVKILTQEGRLPVRQKEGDKRK